MTPAAQAFWFSLQLQDAFGIHTEFAGLRNFASLKNLNALGLSGMPITSAGLQHLTGLNKLTWLVMDAPRVDNRIDKLRPGDKISAQAF